MKVIGLTGGIGSGKSLIRKWFESQGIPGFDSDVIGKKLLNSKLKSLIIEEFGSIFYDENGTLDRFQLANLVFNNSEALERLNNIVHPAVANSFERFKKNNGSASFVIKEAAILFESGAYMNCDTTILVCAPKAQRIQRIINRDHITKEAIEARIKHQWSDNKKKLLSDYVIQNEYLEVGINEAKRIMKILIKNS